MYFLLWVGGENRKTRVGVFIKHKSRENSLNVEGMVMG